MNPVVRWIAYAELVVVGAAGLAIFIATLGSHIPIVITLFNPHAGHAVGLLALTSTLGLALLTLLLGIPLAFAKILRSPAERTPKQLAVVCFGALLLLAAACVTLFA